MRCKNYTDVTRGVISRSRSRLMSSHVPQKQFLHHPLMLSYFDRILVTLLCCVACALTFSSRHGTLLYNWHLWGIIFYVEVSGKYHLLFQKLIVHNFHVSKEINYVETFQNVEWFAVKYSNDYKILNLCSTLHWKFVQIMFHR